MKKKKTLSLLMLLLMTLISCGGGDDDDDDTTIVNTPPQQEQPTPNTPNTPRPPTNSCLSANQRSNITTLMNRLADFSTITGSGAIGVTNADGSVSIVNFTGGSDVQKLSDTSWTIVTNYCRVDDPSICATLNDNYAFIDNCFSLRGQQVRILSTSENTLRISRTQDDGRLESTLNTRNDKFRHSIRGTRNGRTESLLLFEED